MIYLALAILCSTLINWIFKNFNRFKINTIQAIVINYLTCSVVGQLLAAEFVFSSNQIHQNYFWFTLTLGLLFVGIFFCMAKTTELFGISANAVSSKMAFIFPTLFYFLYLDESFPALQIVALILALLAVVLINKNTNNTQIKSKLYYFPILVFIGSGIIDTCMKWIDIKFLNGASPLMPTTTIFTSAFILGIIVLLMRSELKISLKNWLAGIALGLPNYFSIYFLLLAIQDYSEGNTGNLFAINNVGVILLSTIGGILMFGERLNKTQYIGLTLSVITIVIMTYVI